MQRQFPYNVGPGKNSAARGGGGTCPSLIPNEVLFERNGDDSTQYFIDPVQQLLVNTGPAPIAMVNSSGGRFRPAKVVLTPLMAIASLHDDAVQSFEIYGGASVKVYLDAWEPWQTTPVNVYVSAVRSPPMDTKYTWEFVNYVPMGGTPCNGQGTAIDCPRGVETPPIIKTLGSTNRSPKGEYPVSQATKDACKCCRECDRPYFLFKHAGARRSSTPVKLTISIAQ